METETGIFFNIICVYVLCARVRGVCPWRVVVFVGVVVLELVIYM